jgi:hypothetical protein
MRLALWRADADFARVRTHSGLAVIATSSLPGAVQLLPKDAVEWLAASLERLALKFGNRGKPISASDAWRLQEARRRGSTSAWTRAGVVADGQLVDVTARAAAAGLRIRVCDVGTSRFARLAFPESLTEAEVGMTLSRWRLEVVAGPGPMSEAV